MGSSHARTIRARRRWLALFVAACASLVASQDAPAQSEVIAQFRLPQDSPSSQPREAKFDNVNIPGAIQTAHEPDPARLRPHFGVISGMDASVPRIALTQAGKDTKQPKPIGRPKDDGILLYPLKLTPPSPGQLFRLESEEELRERLRNEVRQHSPLMHLEFPDTDAVVPTRSAGRHWPEQVKWVEPNYVISRRLLFEQPHFERYAHSLGILQPAVSTGIFAFDFMVWPARRLVRPFQCYQVNTDCFSPYFQAVLKP